MTGRRNADQLPVLKQVFPDANADVAAYLTSHPRGKYGQIVYHLERDFGIAPARLRQRFAFYYEAYPFLQRS